jgi:hypothetical protein
MHAQRRRRGTANGKCRASAALPSRERVGVWVIVPPSQRRACSCDANRVAKARGAHDAQRQFDEKVLPLLPRSLCSHPARGSHCCRCYGGWPTTPRSRWRLAPSLGCPADHMPARAPGTGSVLSGCYASTVRGVRLSAVRARTAARTLPLSTSCTCSDLSASSDLAARERAEGSVDTSAAVLVALFLQEAAVCSCPRARAPSTPHARARSRRRWSGSASSCALPLRGRQRGAWPMIEQR